MKYIITVIIYLFFGFEIYTQSISNSLKIQIKNQPNQQIFQGNIKGDGFIKIDSTISVNGVVRFQLPQNYAPGLYRIILGQTTYAKLMNEPPQLLDFILNKEDIELATVFKHPEDSLKVIQSIENEVWYTFKQKEKALQEEIAWTEKELDYYRTSGEAISKSPYEKMRFGNRITQYNKLQKQLDSLISKTVANHPNLYATKLIKMYREPFLDGNLNKEQRKQIFQNEYFQQLDFTDESLMNSDVYTKKVFKYLMSYAKQGLTKEQQEQEFKNAVDIILAHTNQNEKVYEFILDYLVSGFEKLRMDNLITYIADKYSGTTCQTDEITTFERKLLQQKMKIGSVVPDFTLNDINGDPVTLSEVLKEKNMILFWASWCPHCNEMIPQIRNWQKSSGLNDVEIIAVSLDSEKEEWENKVFDMGIESWFNLSSFKKWDCPVVLDYNVYATPTMFVIDKNRKILAKPITFYEMIQALK